MQKGYWVTRTYEAGEIGEKIKFFVPGEKPSRSERRIKAELRKQKWNDGNAVKCVARAIHASFRGGRDFLVGMDYSDANLPADRTGANHQLRLWLERVRRACKKEGVEFRYIAVTSDMDGETGEVVRLHHHVIVNAEALEIAIGKWTAGGTYKAKLYGVKDQTGLAQYLMDQVRRDVPDEKKYIPSRNLIRVQPKDRVSSKGSAEVKLPKGGMLLLRSEYKPGQPQYIRYILPEKGGGEDVGKLPANDGQISGT